MSRNRKVLLGYLLAPVPALILGVLVMSRAGVPAGTWVRNIAAALLGVLVVVAASRLRTPRFSQATFRRWCVASGLALLAAPLLTPGLDGVHRWLSLGPLQIHIGAVLLPSLLVLLAALEWAPTVIAAVLAMVVLLLQPDGAQATSFAAGWSVWAAMTHGRRATAAIVGLAILAGATWFRHDPLEPVEHVEGILGLAAEHGAVWHVASWLGLALLPIPLLMSRKRSVGIALGVYLLITILASCFGHYPVPVLGYGVSPILGYYFAIAALQRVDDTRG